MNDIFNFGGHDYEIYSKSDDWYSLVDARTDAFVGSIDFGIHTVFVDIYEPYYDNNNAKKILPKIEFIHIAREFGFRVW